MLKGHHMSMILEEKVKRWTAKRKAVSATEISQGKTTVQRPVGHSTCPRQRSKSGGKAKSGMESALRAKPLDVREQYERQIKEHQEAYGQAMLELRARKKAGVPAGRGREVIETIRHGLEEDGFKVSISKLCQWFDMPRRTVLLQVCHGKAESTIALCRANQGDDQ
jgi:hypothetical protein